MPGKIVVLPNKADLLSQKEWFEFNLAQIERQPNWQRDPFSVEAHSILVDKLTVIEDRLTRFEEAANRPGPSARYFGNRNNSLNTGTV